MTDIPVVGFVIQFFGFLIDQLPFIAHAAVAVAIPIALAGLCGVISERSGVVNIGLEGIMLTAAFVAWITGVVAVAMLGPGEPTAIFGLTVPLLLAVGAAVLSGMILAALHAWLSISIRADQIISGVILNIAALGLTGYLNTIISKQSPPGAGGFQALELPKALTDLPLVGWLINAIFDQGPIAISAMILIVVAQILLFRTRWGLRTRAVGEHPRAAETVGINVIALRYRNVILAGGIAALGGAYLSIELTTSFQAGMSQGRGFIGLAAMIVGRWTPLGAFGAALLFASSSAIGRAITFAAPSNDLGRFLESIPPQVYDALPYLVTIIILAGVIGRSIPPAADGQPYERESADLKFGHDCPTMNLDRRIAWDILDAQDGGGPVPLLDGEAPARLLADTRRIAMVGASPHPDRPSHGVMRYLLEHGYDVVPINPTVDLVLGRTSYATLEDAVAATGAFDIVDVFRRPEFTPDIARSAVATGARALWLQLGVVNWEAAQIAHDAGLAVVMDRCTAIEHRRLRRAR